MSEVSWKKWTVLALLVMLLGWSAIYVGSQLSSAGVGPMADFTITTGGNSGIVKVTVLDEEGRPLQLAYVQVDTDLGEVDEATNAVGEAVLSCPGKFLTAIRVQKQLLLSRPLSVAFGKPALKDGLEVLFVVKDLKAMEGDVGRGFLLGNTPVRDLKLTKQPTQEHNPLHIPEFPGLQSPASVLETDSQTDAEGE